MFFDLHCDTLSASAPLKHPRLFGENESKIFAVFCEDLEIESRAKACERQYKKFINGIRKGEFTQFPNHGTRRVILGMEGASGIKSVNDLRKWKTRGLKVLSLCWQTNRLATGWENMQDVGVSEEGMCFLKEMKELNVMGDVSHLSPLSALQTIEVCGKAIATHSPFYAVFPHPRNLPPRVADALYEKGGIVGITPYPPFLGGNMQAFIQHVTYGLKRYGKRFIAIGTDTDGTKGVFCKELNANRPLMPQIFSLLSSAFDKKTALRICYENAAEFFSEIFE